MDEYRASVEEKPVPFNHLVTVVQTAGGDVGAAAGMLRRGGYEEAVQDPAKLSRGTSLAPAPGARSGHRSRCGSGYWKKRRYLAAVAGKLSPDLDGEKVQDLLYSTAVYTILLGKKSGLKA